MSASLVGSEMCIRDSSLAGKLSYFAGLVPRLRAFVKPLWAVFACPPDACLLYTSDAADDM
eukprot:8848548-Alexandrium_andersonii.AAC.1